MRLGLILVQLLVVVAGCNYGQSERNLSELSEQESVTSSPSARSEDAQSDDDPFGGSIEKEVETELSERVAIQLPPPGRELVTYGDPEEVFRDEIGPKRPDVEHLREEFLESVRLADASPSDFYDRLYSEANFRAFHSGLSEAVVVAKATGATGEPREEVTNNFMTGAGLSAGVTWDADEQILHVSIRQLLRPTTHAVSSHFGCFMEAMLRENMTGFAVPPYFTASGVHHFRFQFHPEEDIKMQDFDKAFSVYQDEYRPTNFEYLEVKIEPPPSADRSDNGPSPVPASPSVGDVSTDPNSASQDATDEPSPRDVAFRNGQLTIRGSTVRFPTRLETLTTLIGQPDRTFDKANVIYVWDQLGIVAYRKQDAKQLHSFEIAFANEGFDFSPRANFKGKVILDGGTIDSAATTSDLKSAGLKRDKQLPFWYVLENPPYTIIAETDDSLVGLSIDWSP